MGSCAQHKRCECGVCGAEGDTDFGNLARTKYFMSFSRSSCNKKLHNSKHPYCTKYLFALLYHKFLIQFSSYKKCKTSKIFIWDFITQNLEVAPRAQTPSQVCPCSGRPRGSRVHTPVPRGSGAEMWIVCPQRSRLVTSSQRNSRCNIAKSYFLYLQLPVMCYWLI